MSRQIILEQRRKLIKEMTLMDDFLMNCVFNDEPEAIKQLLSVILKRDDLQIIQCISQFVTKNPSSRGVRFDVLAKDKDGKLYDIEMQKDERYASPSRARYYSSMLDYKYFQSGETKDKNDPWESLPETYVIFMTGTDYFRRGLPVYTIDRHVTDENNKELRLFYDSSHIIYVNCSYRDNNSDIGRLIHDLNQADPASMSNKILSDRVKYIKEYGEGGKTMSEATEKYFNLVLEERIDEILAKGIEQGKEEGSKNERSNLIRIFLDNCLKADPSMDFNRAVEYIAQMFSLERSEVERIIND